MRTVDPEPVMLAGLKDPVAPPAMVKFTWPLKPFNPVTFIVYRAVPLALMFALAGEAEIEKSGGGGVFGLIVSARVADPVPPPLVALIVMLKVPEPVGVPEITPKLVLTNRPDGKPLAPKLVGLLVAVI